MLSLYLLAFLCLASGSIIFDRQNDYRRTPGYNHRQPPEHYHKPGYNQGGSGERGTGYSNEMNYEPARPSWRTSIGHRSTHSTERPIRHYPNQHRSDESYEPNNQPIYPRPSSYSSRSPPPRPSYPTQAPARYPTPTPSYPTHRPTTSYPTTHAPTRYPTTPTPTSYPFRTTSYPTPAPTRYPTTTHSPTYSKHPAYQLVDEEEVMQQEYEDQAPVYEARPKPRYESESWHEPETVYMVTASQNEVDEVPEEYDDDQEPERTGYDSAGSAVQEPTSRYRPRPGPFYPEPTRYEPHIQYPETTSYESLSQYPEPTRHESLSQYPEPTRYESHSQYPEPTSYVAHSQYPEPTSYVAHRQYPEPTRYEPHSQYPEPTSYKPYSQYHEPSSHQPQDHEVYFEVGRQTPEEYSSERSIYPAEQNPHRGLHNPYSHDYGVVSFESLIAEELVQLEHDPYFSSAANEYPSGSYPSPSGSNHHKRQPYYFTDHTDCINEPDKWLLHLSNVLYNGAEPECTGYNLMIRFDVFDADQADPVALNAYGNLWSWADKNDTMDVYLQKAKEANGDGAAFALAIMTYVGFTNPQVEPGKRYSVTVFVEEKTETTPPFGVFSPTWKNLFTYLREFIDCKYEGNIDDCDYYNPLSVVFTEEVKHNLTYLNATQVTGCVNSFGDPSCSASFTAMRNVLLDERDKTGVIGAARLYMNYPGIPMLDMTDDQARAFFDVVLDCTYLFTGNGYGFNGRDFTGAEFIVRGNAPLSVIGGVRSQVYPRTMT
eukprot:TRINITY_DN5476_c0_g1_i7.p1 TRINITY_DN5476_c0_g1~~TRINITY_DN5476_c0_g1_i7.p1  ORF type:complete len:768 (-),score=21.00 TRINITY_DN5476_c0_g1_i7:246-2549(-)